MFQCNLISMLGTLPEKPKSTWREKVPTLVHAYNCTRNNATGFSPYYLMFGCKLCLPIDLILEINLTYLKGNHIPYIKNLKKKWPEHMKLLMMIFRRNRKGTNNVMTAKFDV